MVYCNNTKNKIASLSHLLNVGLVKTNCKTRITDLNGLFYIHLFLVYNDYEDINKGFILSFSLSFGVILGSNE